MVTSCPWQAEAVVRAQWFGDGKNLQSKQSLEGAWCEVWAALDKNHQQPDLLWTPECLEGGGGGIAVSEISISFGVELVSILGSSFSQALCGLSSVFFVLPLPLRFPLSPSAPPPSPSALQS